MIPHLLKSFGRSEYLKNIAILVSGTAIAQALPVAVSPILARLFTPEDFGLFAVYFSISMVISVVATAKYEMAIVLPTDEYESKQLMKFSILICLVVSFILLGLVLIFRFLVADLFNSPGLEVAILFLPLSTLVIGCTQSLQYFLNRNKNYKGMAVGRIARGVGYAGTSLAAGFLTFRAYGLILGDILGQIIGLLTIFKKEYFEGGIVVAKEDRKKIAARYANFPKFLIPSGLLEKISSHSPVFLIASLFKSTPAVGFYSMAQRTIIAPADLIVRAIGDVFRQQASEHYGKYGECKQIFLKTFKRLLSIAIIPYLTAFFFVEDVFALVFGEPWRVAGTYAHIMMPMFFLQFVVSPLSIMFVVAERQHFDLAMQVFLLLVVLTAFGIGFFVFHSLETALMMFSAFYCLKYLIEFFLSYHFSKGVNKKS